MSLGPLEVLKDTVAYDKPNKSARVVGKFLKGTKAEAITGELHVKPGIFFFNKRYEKFVPGDRVWIYTSHGEGTFLVWYKGRMAVEDVFYCNPYDRKGCEKRACPGILERELRYIGWWVKIRSLDGWVGWTHQADNFDGFDRFGLNFLAPSLAILGWHFEARR